MSTALGGIRDLYIRLLPEDFRRAVIARRRSRIWLNAGIVFVHIPKAAGTSINEALYGRFMGHVPAIDIRRHGSRAVRRLPFFSVTRNPWDRLVSAYRFAKAGQGIGDGVRAGMFDPEQYRAEAFRTFESFVREWLAPRDILKLDNVFQPQWPFIGGEDGSLHVDFVGRFEKLDETRAFVERTLGRSVSFARSNLSGPAVDFRDSYDPALANLVGDIYREDVERFGYDF